MKKKEPLIKAPIRAQREPHNKYTAFDMADLNNARFIGKGKLFIVIARRESRRISQRMNQDIIPMTYS